MPPVKARLQQLGGVCLTALLALFATLGCKPPPKTDAGTPLGSWTHPDKAGTSAINEEGPSASVERTVVVSPKAGESFRVRFRIEYGRANEKFADGTEAKRETPRKIDVDLVDPAPYAVRASCEADPSVALSRPTEKRPTVLFAPCDVSFGVNLCRVDVEDDGTLGVGRNQANIRLAP